MSTINNTDLFLVSRAGTSYQVTAADVASYSTTSGLPVQAGQGGLFLTTNGSTLSWAAAGGASGVTSWSGGTTGLTPASATTGAVTLAGILNIANGGTGASTLAGLQAAALPTQAPADAGKFLSTNGSTASWAAAGTVTSVTGTLPITVATGTTTPLIAINAATNAAAGAIEIATLAEAAAGTDATRALTPESGVPKDASGMAGAALLPGSAAAFSGTVATGMIRYNNSTPPAVIEYYNGSAWVALGGLAAASLAQAATGTSNAVANTPQTSVPKDASGMTGAAIIPSGTQAQRPGTPTLGMTRVNTTTDTLEFYDGTVWKSVVSNFGDPGGWFGHAPRP